MAENYVTIHSCFLVLRSAKKKKTQAVFDAPEVNVVINGRAGPQARSYNRPRAAEIAVIIPEERSRDIAANPRDIVVRKRGGGLQPLLCEKMNHENFL